MFATVVISNKQAGIGNGLTYRVGQGIGLGLGQLVKVPLRKKLVEGIVVDLSEKKPEGDFDIKEIAGVIGGSPLLSEAQVETAKWIAEYYCCTLRQALTPFLPGTPWSRLVSKEDASIRAAVSSRVLRGEQSELRSVSRETSCATRHDTIKLTPRQTAAYKTIKADPRPTLLFGVTGSGKTEIYAALIEETIRKGKSAILLLPEILLTENVIERFQKLVARDAIALIHSRLTPAKRREEWRRCASGEVRLVIGSRSALFSPLPHLGLIIIDEEHEWTYKNEQAPRYHAVKVAEVLCGAQSGTNFQYVNILKVRRGELPKLVLGSATPSVESWHKAKTDKYQLVELPERYGNAQLPSVRVIDLGDVKFGKYYPLSPALLEAIRMCLERHEQCILFLNRRGFATNLLCKECRYRFEDPETKLPYTVHHRGKISNLKPQTSNNSPFSILHSPFRPYLLSHHTGETLPIPEKCPQCGSANLLELGAGTQRIESLLSELYPSARILRADADTLRSPEHMRTLLENMRGGRADILLGTQSVVKGLDLPNVTLAAVLLADIGLSLPHFRAGERVFQLLTQLTGRAGRHQPERPSAAATLSEVIIQTFRPKALEVALAASHNVRAYLDQELSAREKAHYPPNTQLIRFVFSGPGAVRESFQYTSILKTDSAIRVSRSPTLFSGGKDWQVLVRGKGVQELLRAKKLPKFDCVVDVDPVECL